MATPGESGGGGGKPGGRATAVVPMSASAAAAEEDETHALADGSAYAEDLARDGDRMALVSSSDFADTKSSRVGAKRAKRMSRKGGDLLQPGSPFMRRWDIMMMLLMLFTALVTPYEAAFMAVKLDGLFVVNRLVDLCFLFDLGINFFAPYQGTGKDEGQWVHDPRKIAMHYLKTWFFVDLISLIPFDVVSINDEGKSFDQLKIIRVVRLFRLLKLFRVLRASRIMKRWETMIDLNYKIISLVKFALLMCFVAHWMACSWALTGSLSSECGTCSGSAEEFLECCPDSGSWLTPEMLLESGGDQYAASLYWAVMTLSTIGYGDITPMNVPEQLIAVFSMLCGASLWAYVVGNVCGVVASLDVRTLQFRQTMDDLNYFMSDKRLPPDLQRRLREYFHQARHMHQTGNYVALFGKMSPKLRGDVALTTNHVWIDKVSYFRHIRDDCLSAIAVTLRAMVYAPNEIIPGNELHIVMRGVAAQSGRIITRGNVWGEDMIMENHSLANLRPVRALTYIDVSAISREELFDVLDEFPKTRKKIQRAALFMAFVRFANNLRHHKAAEARAIIGIEDAGASGETAHSEPEPSPAHPAQTAATDSASMHRVEQRLQDHLEALVNERVGRMEERFAGMADRLEALLKSAASEIKRRPT